MTINHEVKGQLAKLLATEDLVVEHRAVDTAQFNVHTRVLTLPQWNKASNNVYDMLRTRLPQEISDEVVKLISYNKEAFADFASIENQEDVTSFNEKYGVELVIDVATV